LESAATVLLDKKCWWVKAVAGKKQEAPERGFSLLAMPPL